jgi:hypothetical protein
MPKHQNFFATNLTSNQLAGVTTTPLNSIPTIDPPFWLVFDRTNKNGHAETVYVTSKTSTNVLHAATTYAHTTDEEVAQTIVAEEVDGMYTDGMPYGMARQAIMNGNFDVWQRGTSVALVDSTVQFQADRWQDTIDKNGGTLPTLTRSRQLLTSGDIPGSFYFTRVATNGAGTSLGVSSVHYFFQRIERGTANLCGLNKKVTVSFYARSSIANKRICLTLTQEYGSGGSPAASEQILGTPITLTSSWTKYTVTFTTNTLVGKTFGTNNDDSLRLNLWQMWGTTFGNANVQAGVTAETYVGAGNIDIAQVQLCSGDVALPFQPKSYEEELMACQRYYEVVNGTHYGFGTNACFISVDFSYKVTKRTAVTPAYTEGTLSGCAFNANTASGIDNAVRVYNGTSGSAIAMSVVGAIAKCEAEL